MRDRLFHIFLIVEICLTVFAVVTYLEKPNFKILLLLAAALIGCSIWYHMMMMKRIKQFTNYLTDLQHGNYKLQLSDYEEGELSILKAEIYKVSLRLIEQADLLKQDKKYLSDAISDISHQLKTPLTSMGIMADLLCDETLPPEKRMEFVENIHNGLERMSWLITTLLKMSKLDAGSVELKKECISVEQLVKRSVEHLLIPMELKNQTLVIKPMEEITFIGDFSWSVEALSNIIKNCIEHTKHGGIITIGAKQNHIYTKITIQDTGVGIAKEDLPHIFERFYKGKNSSSDSVGIGLALSKQIITMQKGVILVESKEGEGTEFTLKLYR